LALKYLLILFIVALALAPLTHFLPSKRQRLEAKLREYAAVHGLFVEFRDLPARRGNHADSSGRSEKVIYYGKRLPPSREKSRSRLAWLPEEGSWRGVGHREAVPACSEQLPAAIAALGMDEASCGIYWQEQGVEADVEQIVQVLEAWSKQI
jgi:hypothetical protein